ncbi:MULTISPECIES: beta-ketoacyl-[acyl-carrier-protein] synthase family protein [Streptomyces]|uniref:3-oxoacyl-ACP synthase n=1 Tax=Streptomyces albus (strain ATCC 21838 / DSM 41398 / FERM P-419 / JCM 4703 / NBRC 107858) TaxID=1081613 RepID=A0A0B5F1A6_STRA4|nr:beta-ketoacyl-[acyl-carrier-protein] synthase family protein [Streptomyces sp. SCSIO ZS0520]AJE85320.1 3-oxoacyl-ACP synthase [Streptomyces albus]AOU79627.1 3-Oxoacyl-(acyl-carrier-protein) synthase III [Streptomyces albus]AYN35350.1 beta-ketoacyl-acyl-carrier-protein synthase II [Streptomyces albus]
MPGSTGPFHAAVTGIGMVTAAGIGTQASWDLIRDPEGTAASEVPALDGNPAHIGCWIPGYDADKAIGRRKAWRYDRSSQLALTAAAEAVADSGLDPGEWDGTRVAVVLGSGIGGAGTWEKQHNVLLGDGPLNVSPLLIPMLAVNMSAGYVAMDHGARGPNFVTATACASGTTAIGMARELLRQGVCDVVITGGTEACLIPSIISGFSQMGALSKRQDTPRAASRPFDVDRDGFVPAEGAAVLVLERAADARARGARVYANLSGYGASADAHHATAPDPSGAGAELALRACLDDAGLAPDAVDHVNAHGTSTPLNDAAEAKLIRRVLGQRPAVTSIKGVVGHSLGAAGAIEAAVTALTVGEGVIPPTANLESQDPEVELDVVAKTARTAAVEVAVSNSFGFGGQNAVLAFSRA